MKKQTKNCISMGFFKFCMSHEGGVHLKAGNSDDKNTWEWKLKAKLGRNTIFDGN